MKKQFKRLISNTEAKIFIGINFILVKHKPINQPNAIENRFFINGFMNSCKIGGLFNNIKKNVKFFPFS